MAVAQVKMPGNCSPNGTCQSNGTHNRTSSQAQNAYYTQGIGDDWYYELIHSSQNRINKINAFMKPYETNGRDVDPEKIHGEKREELEGILHEHDPEVCACETCTCQLHPCPLRKLRAKYPRAPKTTYKNDYVKFDADPCAAEGYNANRLPSISPVHPLDDKTRYKIDYVEHKPEEQPARSFARRPQEPMPFTGNTKYRTDYVDWGIPTIPPVETVNTRPKVPFEGKSTYGDSYVPLDLNNRAKPMRKVDSEKPDNKFTAVTTKMVDYKPFKIAPLATARAKKDAEMLPSFPGQYLSTARKDFGKKKTERPCPVVNWPQLPIFGRTSGYYRSLDRIY